MAKKDVGTDDGEVREIGPMEAFWSFFSSMKTAIVLVLLLAVISVVGTVIPQGQPAEFYTQWYQERLAASFATVGLTDLYHQAGHFASVAASLSASSQSLGLTDLYHSHCYKVLLALIGLNLTVCSLNRFSMAWRRTFQPKVAVQPEHISKMHRSDTMASGGNVEEVAAKVAAALRSGSYRVLEARGSNGTSLYGAKGRLSIWGPYLTHLSILIIFAGAILGSTLGFEGYTTITEGKSADSYHVRNTGREEKLGFQVALRKFTIEHDDEHNPIGYKSDLAVYDGGKIVKEKVIDVNHPLSYRGVSFFQLHYGLVGLVMKVTSPTGEIVRIPIDIDTHDASQGKQYSIAGAPFEEVKLGKEKLTLFIRDFAPDYVGGEQINASFMPLNPAVQLMANDRFPEYKGLDAWSNLGWLELSKSIDYKGFTVTLEDAVEYTGLQVSRNPGLPIIYAGFGLMLAGVFISLYITHRVIRVAVLPSKDEGRVSVLCGGMSRAGPSAFDRDFGRLRDALA